MEEAYIRGRQFRDGLLPQYNDCNPEGKGGKLLNWLEEQSKSRKPAGKTGKLLN